MAELLSIVVRAAKVTVGLAIFTIFFAPLILWIWPFVWPWLMLFSLLAFYSLLNHFVERLEGAKQLREDE